MNRRFSVVLVFAFLAQDIFIGASSTFLSQRHRSLTLMPLGQEVISHYLILLQIKSSAHAIACQDLHLFEDKYMLIQIYQVHEVYHFKETFQIEAL